MKNALIALGFVLAGSTAAFADSGVLDVVDTPPTVSSVSAGVDYTATASIGDYASPVNEPRLGDGSPTYNDVASTGVDYTATASIGYANPVNQPRLGDGSPVFLN